MRIETLLTMLIAALLTWGCATTPGELTEARSAYKDATASNASQYAPTELREARKALHRAEVAHDKDGNTKTTRTFAYVAKRRAQYAMVVADAYEAEKTKQHKEKQFLAKSEQARKMLTSKLKAASEYAKLTSAGLQQERQRLEEARAKLEAERRAGALTGEQLEAQQARLQKLSNELAAEREKRRQMQANLDKLKAELQKVASIKEERKQMIITLTGEVLFEVNKATLRPVAERQLDKVAEVLLAERQAEIVVAGHTDSQGKASYNERLSRDRAEVVRNYLVGRGVAANRIQAVGMGESKPIAPNDSPEGRANNRRVEIIVDRQSERAALTPPSER